MTTDRDWGAELDALGDEQPAAPEAPVGVSQTAREIETSGGFDEVKRVMDADREQARSEALLGSFGRALKDGFDGAKALYDEHAASLGAAYTMPARKAADVGAAMLRGGGEFVGLTGTGLKQYGESYRNAVPDGASMPDRSGEEVGPLNNPIANFMIGALVKRRAVEAGYRPADNPLIAAGKSIEHAGKEFAEQPALKSRINSLDDIKKEQWFEDTVDYVLMSVGKGVGTMVPLAATSLANPAAGTGLLYTMSVGEVRQQFDEEGVDPRDHEKLIYSAAALHASLEYIPGFKELKAALAGKEIGKKVEKAILRRMASGFLKGGMKEGITEGLQTAVELSAVTYAATDSAGNVGRRLVDDVSQGTKSQIIESMVQGALTGGVIEGGMSIRKPKTAQADTATTPPIVTEPPPKERATQPALAGMVDRPSKPLPPELEEGLRAIDPEIVDRITGTRRPRDRMDLEEELSRLQGRKTPSADARMAAIEQELAAHDAALAARKSQQQAAPDDTTTEATTESVFDPYDIGLVPTLQRQGEDGLRAQLDTVNSPAQLQAMARAQRIVLPEEARAPSADPAAIKDAIVAAAMKKVNDRLAAAGADQSSFLAPTTTKDKIAAAAKTKGKPTVAQQDVGGLFGDSAQQTDLVDMLRQPQAPARTTPPPLPGVKPAATTSGAPSGGFTTAKGSSYVLHPDGTTTRNNAARSDPGHEGDFGPKTRSEKTYYVPEKEQGRLGQPQGSWRMIDNGNGTLSLATRTDDNARWGMAPSQRDVPVTTTPGVGLIPIELWGKESIYGRDAYRTVHFGNPITQMADAAPAAAPRTTPPPLPQKAATPLDRARDYVRRQPKPVSLVDFIRRGGGIKDVGGGIRAMDGHKRPGLINKNGMALDEARRLAVEHGYLKDAAYEDETTSSVDDLLEAIRDDLSGKRVYSTHDSGRVADIKEQTAAANADDRLAAYRTEMVDWHAEYDLPFDMSETEVERAAAMLANGSDIDTAITESTMATARELEDAVTSRDQSPSGETEGTRLPGWDDDGSQADAPDGAQAGRVGTAGGSQVDSGRQAELEAKFRTILAGTAPKAQWATDLGVDAAGMDSLVQWGIAQGLLRQRANGVVARTPAAKEKPAERTRAEIARSETQTRSVNARMETHNARVASGAKAEAPGARVMSGLTISPSFRAEKRAERMEKATGVKISEVAKDYAAMLEEAGSDQKMFDDVMAEIRGDDAVSKKVLGEIAAAYTGEKPGKSDPMAAIAARFTRRTLPVGASGLDIMTAKLSTGGFETIVQARQFAKLVGIGETGKALDELIENAVVAAAREIIAEGNDPATTYRDLVALYDRQPNLGVRTSTSVANQAYSTPMPLAYLASRLAGVSDANVVYEPTAGNGALLIETDPSRQRVVANELDTSRAAALAAQGFKTTSLDATDPSLAAGIKQLEPAGSVIMNPPFGAVKDKGKSKAWKIGTWSTTAIDHAIALRGLEAMADNGRAVLILGGIKAKDDTARRAGYRGKTKREFFARLYDQYQVVDHFTVDGDLYKKQGAGWPVDVVVIAGRGKSARRLPAAQAPVIFDSWDGLQEKLDAGNLGRIVGQIGEALAGEPGPAERDAVGSVSTAPGVPDGVEPDVKNDAGAVRSRPDRRQPADAGEPAAVESGLRGRGVPGDAGAADQRLAPRQQRVRQQPTGGQALYEPKSNSTALDTLIPVNMATAAQSALDRVTQKHGSVDTLVADRLGYVETDLPKYFSAEQVDAIALAIDNIERGSAFIIGDQTGIGKGRIVAGLLRYAMRRNLTPVLVTEKPDLYGDMFRDLRDIGVPEMLGRDISMLPTNTGMSPVPLDETAMEWKNEKDAALDKGEKAPPKRGLFLNAPSAAKAVDAMASVAQGGKDFDIVLTTYDQMNTIRGQTTDRRRFLEQIAPNALFAFDESHNAGGQAPGMFVDKDKAPNRAEFARTLAASAKGVLFSSATYAKRPDVMDLYARTDMGKAVDDPKLLPDLIQSGGVPMQQIVATMLADSGQYLRRERSFDGVEYAIEGVPIDVAAYTHFSDSIRAIFQFDLAVKDTRDEIMEEILDEKGYAKTRDDGIGGGGASSTNFASIMHNIIGQMLLAIKAGPTATRAITALKAGEKPVIALAGTMESFLKDFAEEAGIEIDQPIDIDFGVVLKRYLSRTLRITVKDPNGDKEHIQIPVPKLPGNLQVQYKAAMALINEGDYSALPVSPIDHIRAEIAKAGYSVTEVTGRGTMIDYSQSPPRYVNRPRPEMGPPGKRASIAAFNAGTLDALILNRSGSTGVSMHAYSKFKDKRRRRMIIAQAEANIDTHMQMLGRVHRTGQVIAPAYSQIAAEIPAEARPTAVLMKKMASLNANTTGARSSAFMADSVDFMNEIGDRIVGEYLTANPEIDELMGDISSANVEKDGVSLYEEMARKATGRLVLLSPEQQQQFLDDVQKAYGEELAQLDAMGENPLEAKTVDLAARLLDSTVLKESQGEGPFMAAAQIERVSVKAQGRALPLSEVADSVAKSLQQFRPDGEATTVLADLAPKGAVWMQQRAEAMRKATQEFVVRDIADLTPEAKKTTSDRHQAQFSRWMKTIRLVHPGSRVTLALPDGNLNGIVLSVEREAKGSKNPTALGAWKAKIAVPDSMRMIEFPFSKLFPEEKPAAEKGVVVLRDQTSWRDMNEAFEAARREGRETRYVVTGNILGGFDQVKGKGRIVNFTMEDGSLRPGVLMGRDFGLDKFMAKRAVRFKSGAHVLAFLDAAPLAEIKSTDGNVTVRPLRGQYQIETAASRAIGGKYYLDKDVLSAIGRDFVRTGNKMVIQIDRTALPRAIDALRAAGALFETTSNQDAAVAADKTTASDDGAYGGPARGLKFKPSEAPDDASYSIASIRSGVIHDTIEAEAITSIDPPLSARRSPFAEVYRRQKQEIAAADAEIGKLYEKHGNDEAKVLADPAYPALNARLIELTDAPIPADFWKPERDPKIVEASVRPASSGVMQSLVDAYLRAGDRGVRQAFRAMSPSDQIVARMVMAEFDSQNGRAAQPNTAQPQQNAKAKPATDRSDYTADITETPDVGAGYATIKLRKGSTLIATSDVHIDPKTPNELTIDWIEAEYGRLSLSDIKGMRESIRKTYPNVTKFAGVRISGAKDSNFNVGNDRRTQSVSFSLGSVRPGETKDWTPAAEKRLPEIAARIEDYAQQMLPPNVAAVVSDRIVSEDRDGNSYELEGGYHPGKGLVELSLQYGVPRITEVARHETVHALRSAIVLGREVSLFTGDEWSTLLDRARKVGVDEQITMERQFGNSITTIPSLPEFARVYRQQAISFGMSGAAANSYVNEKLNQERVAKLAELYEGGTRFGNAIDALMERAKTMLDIIRKALADLGFTNLADVLQDRQTEAAANRALGRMVSGEVAARYHAEYVEAVKKRDAAVYKFDTIWSADGQSVLDAIAMSEATPVGQIGRDDPHPGPVLAYHGTPADVRGTFDLDAAQPRHLGIYFGANETGNLFAGSADGSRVIPVVLNIKSPLTLPDLELWGLSDVIEAVTAADSKADGLLDRAKAALAKHPTTTSTSGRTIPSDTGVRAAADEIRRTLERLGYDGVRYWNPSEGNAWSYIAYKQDTVRSALTGDRMLAIGGTTVNIQQKIENMKAVQDRIHNMKRKRVSLDDQFDVEINPSVGNVVYYVVPKGKKVEDRRGNIKSIGTFIVKPTQRLDVTGVEVTNASMYKDWQRKGIGTKVYDMVAKDWADLGGLSPSPREQLSDAAQAFWTNRLGHESFSIGGTRSDLDMSPEAKKQRAKEMGFDTETLYYHASPDTFDAFDLSRGGGALGPSFGKGEPFFRGSKTYYLRLKNRLSFNTGYEVTPRELVRFLIDGTYQDFNGDVRPVGVDISPADKAVLAATVSETGWSADRAEIVRGVMRRHGVDGFEFIHEMATETIPFDPANIRSVDATFDAAQSNSSNVMLSIGGTQPTPPRPFGVSGLTGEVYAALKDDGTRLQTYNLKDAVMVVSEHEDGRWEVREVRVADGLRGTGFAEQFYDRVQADLGTVLSPSGWLSDAGYKFWKKRDPDRVQYHQAGGPLFDDMWLSPKQIDFTMAILDHVAEQSDDPAAIMTAMEKYQTLQRLRRNVPDTVLHDEMLEAMFSFGRIMSGIRTRMGSDASRYSSRTWYHGTKRDVDKFSLEAVKETGESDVAIFFSSQPDVAGEYAGVGRTFQNEDGGRIIPGRIRFNNPMVVKIDDFLSRGENADIIYQAKSNGHDAVVFEYSNARYMKQFGEPLLEAVVWQSGTVVSATSGEEMFSFGGINARTADLDSLTTAKDMEANGADRTAILEATGWFSEHGKWYFEIDDRNLAIRYNASAGTGIGGPDSVIDHPELAAAYPDISSTLNISLASGVYSGSYNSATNELRAASRDRNERRKIIGHELDHMLQDTQGAPVGASLSSLRIGDIIRAESYIENGTDPFAVEARKILEANPGKEFEITKEVAYRMYAGENMAYATERRLDLSPEQRRARAPWLDYDVPAEQQIVRYEKRDQQSSIGDGSFSLGGLRRDPNAPKSIMEIIADLKQSLDMTATQGLARMTVAETTPRFRVINDGAVIGNFDNRPAAVAAAAAAGPNARIQRRRPRERRFRPLANLRAQYDRNTGTARYRIATDIDAIAHEGGHHIERVLSSQPGDGPGLNPFDAMLTRHRTEIAARSPDGTLSEGFSEWFRGYVLDHDATARATPELVRDFEDVLDAHRPDLLERIDRVVGFVRSDEYARYRAATTTERAEADLKSYADRRIGARLRQLYAEMRIPGTVSAYAHSIYEQAIAQHHPFDLMVRRLLGVADANRVRDQGGRAISLQVHQDPHKLIRTISDSFKTGLRWIQDGMPNYRHQTDPDHRSASLHAALMSAMGETWNHAGLVRFGAYLESRAAVALWGQWDAKQARLADLSSRIVALDDARPRLTARARSMADAHQRRRTAAVRNDTLLGDRARALGSSQTELRRIQDRVDAHRATLADALAAIDDGSDAARAVRDRARRLLSLVERQQRDQVAEVARIQAEHDGYATQATIDRSEIGRLSDASDRAQAAIAGLDTYRRELAAELDHVRQTGLQRRPHRIAREEHESRIQAWEAANPNLPTAARQVYDFLWQSAVHDHQAGRLSDEELEYRRANRDWYVPLQRDMTDAETDQLGPAASAASRRFAKDKRRTGSDRNVINPIETIIDTVFHRAAATHFNDVLLALRDLITAAGPGSGAIAELVERGELVDATAAEFARIRNQLINLGHTPQDADEMVRRLESDLEDPQMLVRTFADNYGPVRPLLLPYWENGERKLIRINDPALAAGILRSTQAMGRDLSVIVLDALALPATFLRAGVTTNPAFIATNILRDMMAAWVLTGSIIDPSSYPVVTQARGLYHELRQTDMARLYQEVAGLMGGQNVAALDKVRDKADVLALREDGLHLNPLKFVPAATIGGVGTYILANLALPGAGPWVAGGLAWMGGIMGAGFSNGPKRFKETISLFSDMSETATRMGVFTRAFAAARANNPALTYYEAAQEAAFIARDVIDFGRNGSRMMAIARIVPFLNANLQGLDKATRQLLTGTSTRGATVSLPKLTAGSVVAGTIGTLAGGPAVGMAAAMAAPAALTNLQARSAAARALLMPMTKRANGMPLSDNDEAAMADSARAWTNLMLLTGTTLAVSLWYGYGDDDDETKREYDMIDTRVKNRMLPIKILGDWYGMPRPFEFAVPALLIEAAIDAQFKHDPRLASRVRESLADTVTPPIVPGAFNLGVGLVAGYDTFRKRDIVPEHLQGVAPAEQIGAYTSQMAIALGRLTNTSPMMIDWATTTAGGYWGRDVQKASNAAAPAFGSGTPLGRVIDTPVVGTMVQRLSIDPSKQADAMRDYWEQIGNKSGAYRVGAATYGRIIANQGQAKASAYLVTLKDDEQRAYALLDQQTSNYSYNLHPLNRARALVSIIGGLQADIVQGKLMDSSSRSAPVPIPLSPAKGAEVRDILQQIQVAETHNAFVVLKHEQFAERGLIDVKPLHSLLKASSEEVFDQYHRRIGREQYRDFRKIKVADFENVKTQWPELRKRLLEQWLAGNTGDQVARPPGAKSLRAR